MIFIFYYMLIHSFIYLLLYIKKDFIHLKICHYMLFIIIFYCSLTLLVTFNVTLHYIIE